MLASVSITECGRTLKIQTESEVPRALVQTLTLAASVFYDKAMHNYAYIEDTDDRAGGTIKIALHTLPCLTAISAEVAIPEQSD